MRRYQQLELLAPPPEPQPDRWLYAMYGRYQDRTNSLIYIEAGREEQARAIACRSTEIYPVSPARNPSFMQQRYPDRENLIPRYRIGNAG